MKVLLYLALLFFCASSNASSRELLWVTTDITPASRNAMLAQLAEQNGWRFSHLDHPILDAPALVSEQRERMRQALSRGDMVWIDAPHVTAYNRLMALHGPQLDTHAAAGKPIAWITTGPGTASTEPMRRMLSYLQAGGEANVRHALKLAGAIVEGGALPTLPPPQQWPDQGLYHPGADSFFANARELEAWRAEQPELRGKPAIAVLVHRYHFINGATDWLDAWLTSFSQQGMFAYAVFGRQVDAEGLTDILETKTPGGQTMPHPRVMVVHQLTPRGAELQSLFERWKTPVLSTQPYRPGDQVKWKKDPVGLTLSDTPFYLVQPEAAGAIDPIVVTAHADEGRRTQLIERQADAVVAKARRLIALQDRPAQEKNLVAMVYNYPAGGSSFGASFLNVPRSLESVSSALAAAGYDTTSTPESQWISGLQPLLRAYYPDADLRALLREGQAEALPLSRYEAWWKTLPQAVRQRIASHWGEPSKSRYVIDWQGERVFVIPRMRVGKLSVLPQPPREETLNRGQDPFMHRSKAPLSHHYLAVYLWAQQAEALIHFGTHGTQEWAPGKARGLDVLDDALLPLGDLPVIYPYIVDNLGEALTAKRRGRALLVSHRTPVFATAGFQARMAHMHEVMHEWEIADQGPTRRALEEQLLKQFVEHGLDRDLGWSEKRIRADFEQFIEALHPWLDQMAQSSQPRGLAVFGQVPEDALRRQTILQALRVPLIEALGEDIDEAFLIDHKAVAQSRPARWLDVAMRDPLAASTLDLRPDAPESAVPNRAAQQPIDTEALHALALQAQKLERLLITEGEIPGLLTALEGRFLPAAYGGDPIRNPDSLPTGRNLTGLDPSRLPTRQAYEVAQGLFDQWLKDWQAAHNGKLPQRLALSLWAGETLRHQGIMEAQALVALGVKPVWDASGRPRELALIPLSELGRPRVDVLLSVTGSYRDQFPALMALLDQAVEAVSQAEPEGLVARHSKAIASELKASGVNAEQAHLLGRARVFGNASGDYGTGISAAVQDDQLRKNDDRLGAMFLRRMSQPFLGGEPLPDIPEEVGMAVLGAQLRATDAALLSRTSHLYGMMTSDDPFQYLGGLAAAARSAGRQGDLELFVNNLQDSQEVFTQSAQRNVAMEMQTRYLHPGWVEAQKAEGYAGTLQVLKAVQFAWGWQSMVEDSVRADHWQGFYDVFVHDKHDLGVPEWLNSHPEAYAQTLERLVQAVRHGHWSPDATTKKALAHRYAELTQLAPLAKDLPSVRNWVQHILASEAQQAVAPSKGVEKAGEARPKLPVPDVSATPASGPEASSMQRGVLLKRQAPPQDDDPRRLAGLALIFLLLAGGAVHQSMRGRSIGSRNNT